VSCSVQLAGRTASGRVQAPLVRGGRVVASHSGRLGGHIRLHPRRGRGRYTVRVTITVDGARPRVQRRVTVR
jgi:hypothetical protein